MSDDDDKYNERVSWQDDMMAKIERLSLTGLKLKLNSPQKHIAW